jgi:TP901 family phage tail tape measure protein
MADEIVVDIKFRGDAPQFLAELSRQVGRAKQQLQEMGQSTAALSRLENQLARMSATAGTAAAATAKVAQSTRGWAQSWTPFRGQFLAAEDASKKLWRSIDTGIATSEKSIGRATSVLAKFDAQQRAAADARISRAPMDDWDKQFAAATVEADKNTAAMRRAKQAIDDYNNSLSNTRYVLYDVAGTLSILGIGLVAPLAAIVGVSAQFELAFAQVARTSGVTGAALEQLKQDFDDLYGSIPITYEALANIATLAGQLGVPAADIAKFTDTVAKTATVTDLTVEAAATAFGRLNALIPNVRGQYDRLGSAIAKVGVNSVATESEIVNISTQISSMGAFAGLTAQDIIGLSGALASIGAQPELSRGTVTRVFTLMSRAVADGGDSLERFASLSGVSSDQFKKAWGTPQFTEVFLGFMRGIQSEGGNAVAALNELGITSVRDVPLLLRLANAADSTGKAGALLAQTIGDANSGWAENIELQRQYEIISQTVAKRFEVLINNLNLFLQAIGGPMLSSLGEFISFLTDIVKVATDFAQTDIGGAILRVVTVMGALIGVLAIAGGAMALMGASSIGVYQALQFLAIQSPRTTAALLGTAGAAGLANGSLKAGATSALLFSRALKSITIVGALLLLPEVIGAAGEAMDDFLGKNQDVSGQIKELGTDFSAPFVGLIQTVSGSRNVFTDFGNSLSSTGRAFMLLDDALKSMVASGDVEQLEENLRAVQRATGETPKEVLSMFGEVVTAAKDAGIEIKVVGDEIQVVGAKSEEASSGTQDYANSMEALEDRTSAANDALDEYKTKLDEINGTVITAAEASDNLTRSINDADEAMKAEGVTLDGTNNASIRFRDSLRAIEDASRTSAEAILENGGSVEDAAVEWQRGRDQIIRFLTEMGKSPAEAQAMADAMFGTKDQMLLAFRQITAGIQAVPSSKNVQFVPVVDFGPAYAAVNHFIWANNGRRINFYVDGYVGRQVHGSNMIARAGGGSVWGPGTATSDSIPAWLSNGEFVIRTAAARAIGYGRLDAMNRTGRLPAFASGGQVGAPSPVAFPNSMMTELSPTDRSLLARSSNADVNVQVSIADLARQVNAYNAKQAKRGR